VVEKHELVGDNMAMGKCLDLIKNVMCKIKDNHMSENLY